MISRTRQDEIETLTTAAARWLWSLLALFAITAIGLRAWQIHHRDALQQAWIVRCTQIDTLSKAAEKSIKAIWDRNLSSSLGPARMRRSDLERALNGGRPFSITRHSNGTEIANWIDPASGRPFEFDFTDGIWTGIGSRGGSFLYPPPPKPSPLENDVERLRGMIAGWNSGYIPLLWIIALIMFASLRRWRPVMAQVMLALAVVSSLAWLVHPGYQLTSHDVMRNDMLVWGLLMLLVSALALTLTRERRIKTILPVCPKCRYNLTGNVSGICPECGKPIPVELAQRFGLGAAV